MTRFLSGLSLFLLYCSAYAEIAATNVPEDPPPSVVGMIIFGIVFVGSCVGFMWMVYKSDKKAKQGNAGSHDASGKTT